MKKIKILFWIMALMLPGIMQSQTIVKGAGVFYTNGIPTHDPPLCDGSEIAININGGWWYEYSRDSLKWIHAGFRVQKLAGCVAPTGTPGDKESEIVLNDCDSLYRFRGGTWYHLNPVSVGSWTLTDGVDSEDLGGQTLTVSGAGIAVADYDPGTNTLTITATEVDGSVTNEGALTVAAGGANDSQIQSNTSGSTAVTISGGTGITVTEVGNTITIAATATGTDLTFTGASSPVTLNSSTGTDVTFTAGGIITLSATGTNMTITATEVDGDVTNEGSLTVLAGTGSTSVISSNTSGSTNVTIEAAGIITIAETGNTITLTGTEVDGDVTNEGSLTVGAGGANTSTIQSNTSGSTPVTISGGTGITVTEVGNTITIAATATGTDLTFTGASSPVTLNSSTGTDVTFTAGGIITLSATGTNMTITATEVDGDVTNEGSLTVLAGTGSTSVISSNTSGSTNVTIEAAGIITIAETGNTITLTGTEVDGDVTNEGSLTVVAGGSNDSQIQSNTSGSTPVTISGGTGITVTEVGNTITIAATATGTDLTFTGASSPVTLNSSTGTDVTFTAGGIITLSATGTNMTITATEVDGDVTNEGSLTVVAGGSNDSQIQSNTSGSTPVTISGGTGITVTEVGNTITIAATATGTDLTFTGASSPVTLNSSTGTDVTFTAGGIITLTGTGTNMTITATEVDGSVTNEGTLGVGAGGATSSTIISNTSGATGVTINAAGIISISETTSSNGGQITLTGTEVDGSVTNEGSLTVGAGGANTSTINSNTSGSGVVTISGGSNITVTEVGNTITIASTAGGITGAENGLSVSGSNVRLGGTLIDAATSINGGTNELRFYNGKFSVSSWTGFANSPVQPIRFQALEALPTLNSTPTLDGIIEFRLHNSAGSDQPNSLTIGGYTTDNDGMWMQSRSASVPNFELPLSLQPRGGQLSVGRTTNLSALVTFTGSGLAGSTAAGSVLLLENAEGNGKTSLGFGSGSNNLTGEMAMFHATDALRIINRNTTNGTSSVRVAIGGETSDVATFEKSSAASLVQFGVGTVAPHSTVQSAGSFATAYLETVGAPTFDETKRTVIYTASTNITWTLPDATTCACAGRELILHHSGTAGTITLSQSVSKGNGTNFNTLTAGQWAYIIYGSSSIRGYKITSL